MECATLDRMPHKCAFCLEDAVERGGEHIWDDWLNRALPRTRFRIAQQRSPVEPFRQYYARALNEKMAVVCEHCNSTWMSDVTNQIRQTFSELILNGAPVCVLPAGVELLAAFAFMKSVVADHGARRDEPFYTRAVRERFREMLTIPTDVQVWIAAYQGAQRYSGRFSTNYLKVENRGPLYGVEFYSFTYVVGQLVLQTLTPRWKDIRRRGRPIPLLDPSPSWNPAVSRVWPSDRGPVTWPPEKYIGDDMIQGLVDRFNVPIHFR